MATRTLPSEASGPAEPFVKWAGGKRAVLERIDEAGLLPKVSEIGTYWEPFLGGGACFFRLRPKKAVLSDTNEDLITAYRVIQKDPTELIQRLKEHARAHGSAEAQRKKYFYHVRGLTSADLDPVERAARFIYLNKTCFNGLYRVNAAGQFNVPLGRYLHPTICDERNLWRVHTALQGAQIAVGDFRNLDKAKKGDFVYYDPPYHPLSVTSNFTSYTSGNFNEQDQRDLAHLARQLADRGARVLVSNSATKFIERTYGELAFQITRVRASRAINSKASARGAIDEFAISNYPPFRPIQRVLYGDGRPRASNGNSSKK
jgi:DNA adenine methylase